MVIPHLSKTLDNIDPQTELGCVIQHYREGKEQKKQQPKEGQELIANLTQLATADLSMVGKKNSVMVVTHWTV